jgi:hypothetical protein
MSNRIAPSLDVRFAHQQQPTGMLDAILLAAEAAAQEIRDRVWITWCDQIGVHPDTIATLGRLSRDESSTAAILSRHRAQSSPYIHLDRDANGRITAIPSTPRGRRDAHGWRERHGVVLAFAGGLLRIGFRSFGLEATQASATRERNFLPFIPWLIRRRARGCHIFHRPTSSRPSVSTRPTTRRRLEAYLRTLELAVKRLSIVIPAYNEERFIWHAARTDRAGRSWRRLASEKKLSSSTTARRMQRDDCGTVHGCDVMPAQREKRGQGESGSEPGSRAPAATT